MFKVICISETGVTAFEMQNEAAAVAAGTQLHGFGINCFVVVDYEARPKYQIIMSSPGATRGLTPNN